jgi:flagellar biosynthesis/type III secretory pathway protein FliH
VTEYFEPMKKKAAEAHKEICAKEKAELAPIANAEAYLRAGMNTYLQEQERIRQEAEQKARREAEEVARKEREKLEAQAAKAAEKGKEEKAAELLEKAADVYVKPVAVVAPVVQGTTATKLVVEVADMRAFLKAIVEGNFAPTMVEIKPAKLDAWAKANQIERFPGLRIEKTKIAVIR